jgi:hypothetical protein
LRPTIRRCGEDGAKPIEDCETKVVRRFALKAGEVREFNDLPRASSIA